MSKLCLVCSSGGHLIEMHSLEAFWKDKDRFWVTFSGPDAESILRGERVHYGYHPTNRNIKNLFKNFLLALRILKLEKPDIVVSTGAGIGVPFIYAAKLMRIRTIYIESLTFIERMSLTGRLVYLIADHFLVQWPELARKYERAEYKGTVL